MRQFINILAAVYITTMACFPCSDDEIAFNVNENIFVLTAHQDCSGDVDLCSPFCICSCCSARVTQPKYLSFDFYFPRLKEFNSLTKPGIVKAISHAIWQPPKFA